MTKILKAENIKNTNRVAAKFIGRFFEADERVINLQNNPVKQRPIEALG